MPTTRVSEATWTEEAQDTDKVYERKQYKTTIPKQLAENYEIDGDTELRWTFGSAKNKMEVEVLNDEV